MAIVETQKVSKPREITIKLLISNWNPLIFGPKQPLFHQKSSENPPICALKLILTRILNLVSPSQHFIFKSSYPISLSNCFYSIQSSKIRWLHLQNWFKLAFSTFQTLYFSPNNRTNLLKNSVFPFKIHPFQPR